MYSTSQQAWLFLWDWNRNGLCKISDSLPMYIWIFSLDLNDQIEFDTNLCGYESGGILLDHHGKKRVRQVDDESIQIYKDLCSQKSLWNCWIDTHHFYLSSEFKTWDHSMSVFFFDWSELVLNLNEAFHLKQKEDIQNIYPPITHLWLFFSLQILGLFSSFPSPSFLSLTNSYLSIHSYKLTESAKNWVRSRDSTSR